MKINWLNLLALFFVNVFSIVFLTLLFGPLPHFFVIIHGAFWGLISASFFPVFE